MHRKKVAKFDFGEYAGDAENTARHKPLDWRLDPSESLSDWRVNIVVDSKNTTYHVHKAIIAAGERQSDYFVRLCRGSGAARLAEAARGESTIVLDSVAAEAFPVFLDYVYTGELSATKENAIALFHLANYLANPALHAAVAAYLQKTLDYETAPIHLAHAHLFSLDKVGEAALKVCTENLLEYENILCIPGDRNYSSEDAVDPVLCDLFALPPTLFRRILVASPDLDDPGTSQSYSRVLAGYCLHRADDIDASFLEAVVTEDMIKDPDSFLAVTAAMPLLEVAIKNPVNAKLRRVCIQHAGTAWENTLLPLAVQEKRRRAAAKEAAEAATAASARKPAKRQKKAAAATGASGSAAAVNGEPPPSTPLPLGPNLPADVQLELLGNMLLHQGGEELTE